MGWLHSWRKAHKFGCGCGSGGNKTEVLSVVRIEDLCANIVFCPEFLKGVGCPVILLVSNPHGYNSHTTNPMKKHFMTHSVQQL